MCYNLKALNSILYSSTNVGQQLKIDLIYFSSTTFCSNLRFSSNIIVFFTKVAVVLKVHSCTKMPCFNSSNPCLMQVSHSFPCRSMCYHMHRFVFRGLSYEAACCSVNTTVNVINKEDKKRGSRQGPKPQPPGINGLSHMMHSTQRLDEGGNFNIHRNADVQYNQIRARRNIRSRLGGHI